MKALLNNNNNTKNMLYRKKENSYTYLSVYLNIKICKRYYPGYEIGHGQKILNAVSRKGVSRLQHSHSHKATRYHHSMYSSGKSCHPQFRKLRNQYNKFDGNRKPLIKHKDSLNNRELQNIQNKTHTQKSSELNSTETNNILTNNPKLSKPFSPLSTITKTCKSTLNRFTYKEPIIKKDSIVLNNSSQKASLNINHKSSLENREIMLSDTTFPTPALPFGISNNNNDTAVSINETKPTSSSIETSKADNISLKSNKLKNPVGAEYESSITSETSLKDLTLSKLTEELINRHIIKRTQSPAVIIETKNHGTIRVGDKQDELVFTKPGQAYLELQQQNRSFINPPETSKEFLTVNDIDKLCIIIPKNTPEGLVKPSVHMIAAYNPTDHCLYAFATLTSEKTEFELSKEQFKKFQCKQQGKIFTPEEELKNHNKKIQYLRFFRNIQIMNKNEVYEAKYDKDYFLSLENKTTQGLEFKYTLLQNKPYEKYTPVNISNEQLLQICKDVDAEAQKKKPKHPKTIEQLQKEETSKQAQQAQQAQHAKQVKQAHLLNKRKP